MKMCLILLMTAFCASCSTTAGIQPCDVLVKISPSEASARYIVKNDRPLAQQIASHRGRYSQYGCGK